MHIGIRHKCPYCEHDATTKGNLKTHIKGQHPNKLEEYEANKVDGRSKRITKHDRLFVCKVCGTGLTAKHILESHMKNVHEIKKVSTTS